MKILYNDSWGWLKEYEGTENWILVKNCSLGSLHTYNEYIRIINIEDDIYVWCNVIVEKSAKDILNSSTVYDYDKINKKLSSTNVLNITWGNIEPIFPLKVIPTEEFYKHCDSIKDNSIFDKICGKELWILADCLSETSNKYYIRILDRQGNIIKYNRVKSEAIDYNLPEGYYNSDLFDSKYGINHTFVKNINNWKIIEPKEIITTEDLIESLAITHPRINNYRIDPV